MKAALTMLWPDMPAHAAKPGVGAAPGIRPSRTPSELKADETTRVAREATHAAAETRHALTARLRRARLEREAHEKARVALAPPPAKHRSRRG